MAAYDFIEAGFESGRRSSFQVGEMRGRCCRRALCGSNCSKNQSRSWANESGAGSLLARGLIGGAATRLVEDRWREE